MDYRTGSSTRRVAAAALAVAAAAASAWGASALLYEDAEIAGKQIHTFKDAGENVTVVLGEFRLTVGARVVSGRDAVVWLREKRVGQAVRREIIVYVEGDAKAKEPDGTTVSDKVMLVTVHHQGRLTARGAVSQRPLREFPLYKRAVAARKAGKKPAARPVPPPRPKPGPKPPASAPTPGPAATRPGAGAHQPPKTKPKVVLPVTYRADRVRSEVRDGRRITIARGNVYLSQGHPDSSKFIELRSQAAVLFTRPLRPGEKPPARDTRTPLAPGVESAADEAIVAVYLEGDVLVARGEQTLRAPSAFYDFTTDRAILPDAVFRTIQKKRNVPIYIRARQARLLSAREIWFRDARVSTNEFDPPTYHVGAFTAYLMDTAPYDETGERLSPPRWHAEMTHSTFNVRNVPLLYWPYMQGDLEQEPTALRTVRVGRHGRFGIGAETDWDLFRLLGMLEPEGYEARLRLSGYERGFLAGARLGYARHNYSGYSRLYGILDAKRDDTFGDDREDIPAPEFRGYILARHKHLLPEDWQVQLELAYYCDRNFLEQFFPDEFYAGKEQETLIYAKKQRDHWAFTALAKARLLRFETQTESAPDLSFYLIGYPLLDGLFTVFSESNVGMKRLLSGNESTVEHSRLMVRLDTREEINMPLHIGPINVMPYGTGRVTYWDDKPAGGENCRLYGQVGLRANTHLWRVYDGVENRTWNVHRLRHVVTPEATAFLGEASGVEPFRLFGLDPDIERNLGRLSGISAGIYQRLQTKRGRPGQRRTADWMRLGIVASWFWDDPALNTLPADGRFFWHRPEYSLSRDSVNAEYTWFISDATTFLADMNYDLDDGRFGRVNAGLTVVRDPRLAYHVGMRWIDDLDTAIGTIGTTYKINRKYTVSFFEQYDFDFEGGENLATQISVVRKFPRWFVGVTFIYDTTEDDVGLLLTFWPEGFPEVSISGGRLSLLGRSGQN